MESALNREGRYEAADFYDLVRLALATLSMPNASAEEKCKMSGSVAAANTTYTQQHMIDVGDVPGHQVRVFELHHTYPADTKPNCEGLRRTEDWVRGFSDYTDRNGPNWGYSVITLENGDKIFSEFRGVSQTVVTPDGEKKSTAFSVVKYTGGTGRYQAVRGVERSTTVFDLDKKTNEVRSGGEYYSKSKRPHEARLDSAPLRQPGRGGS